MLKSKKADQQSSERALELEIIMVEKPSVPLVTIELIALLVDIC